MAPSAVLRLVAIALLISCCSSKPSKISRDIDKSGLHLLYSLDYQGVAADSWGEVQEQTISIIGKRLKATGAKVVAVGPADEGIVVVLPPLPPAELRRVRKLMERPARLEFRMVDEATVNGVTRDDFMQRLYAFASSDPEALELGITTDLDAWQHPESGRRYGDFWLRADDRYTLTKYLVRVGVRDPELRPDENHRFGYEKVDMVDASFKSYWRTYYLNNEVSLSDKDVAKAYVEPNPYDHRPDVLIDFTPEGAARFGDLTGNNIGRKLAISVDNTINSAPTIQDRIGAGTCAISLGGTDMAQAQRDALDLMSVLNAGALPVPIKLEYETHVP